MSQHNPLPTVSMHMKQSRGAGGRRGVREGRGSRIQLVGRSKVVVLAAKKRRIGGEEKNICRGLFLINVSI